jgi:hypothetical protein
MIIRRHSLFISQYEIEYMKKRLPILRAVSKTVVDYCVMPGTANGAEILWLYTQQWKNRVILVGVGFISLIYSHMYTAVADRINDERSSSAEGKI